jgi:hypothetical protein
MAGLTVLTACHKNPKLTLLKQITIQYPSASAIEFYEDKLFIFGDDAPWFIVTDTGYQIIDTVSLFRDTAQRIKKYLKHDLEAVTIDTDRNVLVAISSAATPNRNYMAAIQLPDYHIFQLDTFSYSSIKQQLAFIDEINLEGLTKTGKNWIAANRANATHPQNYFIISESLPWLPGTISQQKVLWKGSGLIGISGLYYWQERDLLLLTGTEEATANALEDGAIGDSHFAWIHNYSKQIEKRSIEISGSINLSTAFPSFKGHKVESLTLQKINKGDTFLYLVADDDNGASTLFKMKIEF